MRRQRIIWLALLTIALLMCLYRYRLPSRAVTRTRIVVARDVSDVVRVAPSEAKTGYEPYFNRVNAALPYLAVAGVSNVTNTGR
jgi:hypothetical protein